MLAASLSDLVQEALKALAQKGIAVGTAALVTLL